MAEANKSIRFAKIDIDDAADIAQKMQIRSVPTFFFFGSDGKLASTFSGADPNMLKDGVESLKSE
jgi:thioredoxin-like negative regulator of GroEL